MAHEIWLNSTVMIHNLVSTVFTPLKKSMPNISSFLFKNYLYINVGVNIRIYECWFDY